MNEHMLLGRSLNPYCHHLLRFALLLALLVGPAARAALVLDLPDLNLDPNKAGQTFTLRVNNTGNDPIYVQGITLNFVVEDGGPLVGGSQLGPAIQNVSLTASGLLFNGNNQGEQGVGSLAAQVFERYTQTTSGLIGVAPGYTDLATVTFDTTGFVSGAYSWSALTSPNGLSYWAGGSYPPPLSDVSFLDGTLTVPEPVTVALPVFGAVLAGIQLLRSPLVRRWRTSKGRSQ